MGVTSTAGHSWQSFLIMAKKNHQAGKNTAKRIHALERRAFALDMRKTGAVYRAIAEAAITKFGADALPKGYDHRYVYKDVMRSLKTLREQFLENAEAVYMLAMERYNRLLMAVWAQAIQGHLGAGDRAAKYIRLMTDLAGAGAAQRIDITSGGETLQPGLEFTDEELAKRAAQLIETAEKRRAAAEKDSGAKSR